MVRRERNSSRARGSTHTYPTHTCSLASPSQESGKGLRVQPCKALFSQQVLTEAASSGGLRQPGASGCPKGKEIRLNKRERSRGLAPECVTQEECSIRKGQGQKAGRGEASTELSTEPAGSGFSVCHCWSGIWEGGGNVHVLLQGLVFQVCCPRFGLPDPTLTLNSEPRPNLALNPRIKE